MSGLYLETSAVGRVLLGASDAPVIVEAIGRFQGHLSSRLLRTELRRLAFRHGRLESVDPLLAEVALVPIDEPTLVAAETIRPATVRTLDAVHLATIVRLAAADLVDAVITYDVRLADAVREHGVPVVAPT